MRKNEDKVNFDLSTLSLNELVTLYEEITGFLTLLEEKKTVEKDEVKGENE